MSIVRATEELGEPQRLTLLLLVHAIGEMTDDDFEVVAIIRHLLRSGRVRLHGNFRNVLFDKLA